jgi:hypothetical protein
MRIKTAQDQVIVKSMGGYRAFVERLVGERWAMGVNWATQGEAPAYVNRSAWAVNCPFCAGALAAEPGEPFFCPDCAMQGNGFRAMAVLWPEARDEIEALLVRRDDPNTRNWLIGETVGDLARENAERGVI